MASSKADLLRRQRRWADARGVRYDARGFVRDLADNLLAPLAAAAHAELARGSELAPGATRPPRINSLCSSAALVANVFGYWHARDAAPLARALGFEVGDAVTLGFEEPFATGLIGDPPLVDVVLRGDDALIAIESKFAEWLVRRPRNKSGLKDKYFPADSGVWSAAGLPRCQAFAKDLQAARERFTYLNAAQLLKHALGLSKARSQRVSLLYLYYDWPGREAPVHAAELERARVRLGGEVDLRVRTYQELYRALRALPAVDGEYLDYLSERYFGG
jgi:hypothetical protein